MLCCIGRTNKIIDNTTYNTNNTEKSKDLAIYDPSNNSNSKITPVKLEKKIKKDLIRTRTNNLIGSGISSNVFKVKLKDITVSCKVSKEKWEKNIINEIDVLRQICDVKLDGNIFPKYICSFKLNLNSVLCYHFIEGNDLQCFISNDNIFKENENLVMEILYEILRGLKFLLEFDMVHLDIKPENIVLYQLHPIKIKIIDLSFCSSLKDKQEFTSGSFAYISPEVVFKNVYYKNTDIWSVGIITYLLFTEKFIFGFKDSVYVNNIKNNWVTDLTVKTKIKEINSVKIKEILVKSLKYKAIDRITVNSFINLLKKFSTS